MSEPTPASKRAQVHGLAAALISGPVEVLDFVLPLWAGSALGLTPAQIGVLVATETLLSFLSRPVAGVVADRMARGRLAASGAVLLAGSFAGYATAVTLPVALMAAATGGVGGALFWVSLRARVAEGLAEDSGVFPRLFAAEGTGTWIAFAAALTLVSRIDYRGVFWLCAAACLLAAFVLWSRTDARPPPPQDRGHHWWRLGRRMWPLLGVVGITATAEAGVGLLLLLHLQRGYDLGLGAMAAVFLPGFIVYSTLPDFLHRQVARRGRTRTVSMALAGSAVFAGTLAFAPNPWVIALVWVLAAVSFATAIPVEQAVVAEAAGRNLGRAMAVYESANLLGASIGVFGAGLVYGTGGGWVPACVAAAGLLVIAALLVRPALRRVSVADRPEPLPVPLERSLAPPEEPAEPRSPAPATPAGDSARTARRVGWRWHAAGYAVAQVALAIAGYGWPLEAVFGGPHDSAWYWNSSGHWLLNVGRIWTAVFLLDTLWSLARARRR